MRGEDQCPASEIRGIFPAANTARCGTGNNAVATELAPITEQELEHAAVGMRSTFEWIDDGLCLARAALGAELVRSEVGGTLNGPADARHAAAVVVASGPILGHPSWTFHAATIVKVEGRDEPAVVDFLFDENSRWSLSVRIFARLTLRVSAHSAPSR